VAIVSAMGKTTDEHHCCPVDERSLGPVLIIVFPANTVLIIVFLANLSGFVVIVFALVDGNIAEVECKRLAPP
jgi:hypothetical protein